MQAKLRSSHRFSKQLLILYLNVVHIVARRAFNLSVIKLDLLTWRTNKFIRGGIRVEFESMTTDAGQSTSSLRLMFPSYANRVIVSEISSEIRPARNIHTTGITTV
jgi:hypothetical protein